MRKKKVKSIINLILCMSLLLSFAACGKKGDVVVEEYGDTSSEDASLSSSTDSESVPQGGAASLKDVFGESIRWDESFAIDGKKYKVDTYFDIPDIDNMNAFHCKDISDGMDEEQSIVKALFGDTGEKLEKISYTNETDYMMMLYKYRSLIMENNRNQKLRNGESISVEDAFDYTIINSSFTEEYKWIDEADMYIHMYEGMYNNVKFGLLISYDKNSSIKHIYFAPVSIRDYFPDKDYKSLLVTTSNNSAGQPLDIDNQCSESIDAFKDDAEDFVKKNLHIGGDFKISEDSSDYSAGLFDNLALYSSVNAAVGSTADKGVSILRFTDSDYISMMKSDAGGEGVAYSILAEQKDYFSEYKKEHEKAEIFNILYSSEFVTDEANTEFTVDGYALYFGGEDISIYPNDEMDGYRPNNNGMLQYTSKGLFSADITLLYEIVDVTENVQLLDFERIKECLKAELPEKLDTGKLGDPTTVNIHRFDLDYYPVYEDDKSSNFMTIPVWGFFMIGDSNGNRSARVIVNAIDGSIVDVEYYVF